MTWNWKSAGAIVAAAALAVGLFSGCGAQADNSGGSAAGTSASLPQAQSASVSSVEGVKEEDLDASWDEADATTIHYEGESATVEGGGATAEAGDVTITAAGTYLLSGSLEDGQLKVDAPDTALVRIVLNGASLACSDSAPIYCERADKLLIILADGTTNTVEDGESYTFPDETTDEPSAAIFSKQDLTLNGSGTLKVRANYNNGIGTKDDLIIVDGKLDIEAANHALRGRDSVTVLDGTFTLAAGSDGIQANNDQDVEKGWIDLRGGSYEITAGQDGVQAETNLAISGGTYIILAGGGSANAAQHTEDMPGGGGGFAGGRMQAEATADPLSAAETDTTEESVSDSYKGIKAKGNLAVTGGTFDIDSADDAVHANGSITVSGGGLTLSSGDDAFHADANLVFEGEPEVDIKTSYEGLEGGTITIKGGTIDVVASDDGLNAAGGNDGNQGQFGADSFAAQDGVWVEISGGELNVNAGGDGLDSNGDFNMSGGTIYVSGPTNDGNSAIDCNGNFDVTGGTLVAAGSSGMAETPGESSSQPSLMVYFSSTQAAGTTLELKDAAGHTVAAYTPEKEFACVVFSASGMVDGENYTLYAGDSQVVEATLNGAVTSINDAGEAVAGGGMGGAPGGGVGGGPGGGMGGGPMG